MMDAMRDAPSKPTLRGGPARGRETTSVALILHGGRERGEAPTSPLQLSYLRMFDFAWALRRRSVGCAVYLLRYRLRGWNPGPGVPDPVVDTQWALDQLTALHPHLPIAMLGHSMGGRAAFAAADHPAVVGVCGLAPWLPADEPVPPRRDHQRFVIAHGTSDRMTSSPLSREYAERLRRMGHTVARFELPGAKHALLDRSGLWRDFAARTTLGLLEDGPLPRGVDAALEQSGSARFDLGLDTFDAASTDA